MASITKNPAGQVGHKWVQFIDPAGHRKTIRLGKVPTKLAQSFKDKVESLLSSKITGAALARDVSVWLAGLDDSLFEKLVAVGLTAPRRPAVSDDQLGLEVVFDAYIKRRTDVKPRTMEKYVYTKRSLLAYFVDVRIDQVTRADAKDWFRWAKSQGAEATASKFLKVSKMIFEDAIDRELITTNPFRKLKAPQEVNEARKKYVDVETVQRVIDSCPSKQWKLIIALCRHAGLRCPSEILRLTWDDVLWDKSKFVVHASKTEHHRDGGIRIVPLFPELLPYLESVYDDAPEGTKYVITQYRDSNANLRTQFLRLCKRAAVQPWPKLFQNLRASCETDLVKRHPIHVASYWIGNSEAVARDHYLTVNDSDYRSAVLTDVER